MPWAGPLVSVALAALALHSRIAWPWRALLALGLLLLGLHCWRRYLRYRPVLLRIDGKRRLHCLRADGAEFRVGQVRRGIVTPWLLSATLVSPDGVSSRLLVPGWGLGATAHRHLRVMLMAARDGATAGADQSGRLGT
jgi:hypothetical protein